MLALVVSVMVSQAAQVPAGPRASTAPAWGAPVTWQENGREQQAWVSPIFVAEPAPSDAGAAAVKALDAGATVVVLKPAMRVWRVKDAAAALRAAPKLVVVLHDLKSSNSRMRVPVGAVCGGERVALPGLAALERVSKSPECLPDFWMPGALK